MSFIILPALLRPSSAGERPDTHAWALPPLSHRPRHEGRQDHGAHLQHDPWVVRVPARPAIPVHACMRALAWVLRCWARASIDTLSAFLSPPSVRFLRGLASGGAHGPMAISLLTPVGVQTLCQKPRAAGVLAFYHGCQPRPDALRGARAARGPWRTRGSVRLAVPGRVPAGEHPADRVARPWRPEGPAVGPMPSLQARRSIRRRPHSSCTLSGNACGPPRVREGSTRAHPARTTVPSPRRWLSLMGRPCCCAPSLTLVVSPSPGVPTAGGAHPWGVPTYRQRTAWQRGPRRPASPRVSHGVPMTSHVRAGPAHAGMVLALLRACCTGAQYCPLRSREHCRTLGTIEGARLATAYGPRGSEAEGPHQASARAAQAPSGQRGTPRQSLARHRRCAGQGHGARHRLRRAGL